MNALTLLFVLKVVAGGDDLYDKLHVSRSATTKELKAAYRREATIWYIDNNFLTCKKAP